MTKKKKITDSSLAFFLINLPVLLVQDDLTQEKLLAPALHPPPDQKKKKDDEIRGEELMRNLLAAPTHFAIQIGSVILA
jgi:hypothetical protein